MSFQWKLSSKNMLLNNNEDMFVCYVDELLKIHGCINLFVIKALLCLCLLWNRMEIEATTLRQSCTHKLSWHFSFPPDGCRPICLMSIKWKSKLFIFLMRGKTPTHCWPLIVSILLCWWYSLNDFRYFFALMFSRDGSISSALLFSISDRKIKKQTTETLMENTNKLCIDADYLHAKWMFHTHNMLTRYRRLKAVSILPISTGRWWRMANTA